MCPNSFLVRKGGRGIKSLLPSYYYEIGRYGTSKIRSMIFFGGGGNEQAKNRVRNLQLRNYTS